MFSGLTRNERWILLSLVAAVGIGLGANEARHARRQRVFALVDGARPRELTHVPPPPQDAPPQAVPNEGEKINLNTASAADLQRLDGIGEKKAKAILDDRAQNGPFRTLEDLQRVKGIGPATLEKFRPYITVGGASGSTPGASVPGSAGAGPPRAESSPVPFATSAPYASPPSGPGLPSAVSSTGQFDTSSTISADPPPGGLQSSGVPPVVTPLPADDLSAADAASSADTRPVNINTADFEELKRLHGVGDVLARRILAYRMTYGSFRRPEDLMKVKGIGTKTLEKNRHLITVN